MAETKGEDLVERDLKGLRESADALERLACDPRSLAPDGVSTVTQGYLRLREAAARIQSDAERLKAVEGQRDALRLQAECWAMEAKGHKASLHEAYQAITGATGEPGNWNGAKPIIEAFRASERREQEAIGARDEAMEALRQLRQAADDMLVGIGVHNRLGKDAPARRDDIEGPVVTALADAARKASDVYARRGSASSDVEGGE
jgi:hypothetical protein